MNNIITVSMICLLALIGFNACSESELDSCLEDCGELEGFPLDSPCGENGWLYHNQCEMGCHGVAPADDKLLCASDLSAECDEEHTGLAAYNITRCGGFYIEWCETPGAWGTNDMEYCHTGALFNCFENCPLCPEDETEFICGEKGVLYCNQCVMTCLEDEEAADDSICSVKAKPAAFCEEATDTFATRDSVTVDYGCNACECQGGLWHCSFWACPGQYSEE